MSEDCGYRTYVPNGNLHDHNWRIIGIEENNF